MRHLSLKSINNLVKAGANTKYPRTTLELTIHGCSRIIFDPEPLKKPFISLNGEYPTDIDVGKIYFNLGKDAICKLTEKPCVLSQLVNRQKFIHLISYNHRERCPSFKPSTQKYILKGIENGFMFYISQINKLKNKKITTIFLRE